jgi:hypothetical protein
MQTADRAAPVRHAKVCCESYQGISTPIAMKDMLKAKTHITAQIVCGG